MNRPPFEPSGGGSTSAFLDEDAARAELDSPEMVEARDLLARFLQSRHAPVLFAELIRWRSGLFPIFEVTRIEKSDGKVTKQIRIKPDGKTEGDSSQCRIANGIMHRVKVRTLHDFGNLIQATPGNTAWLLGSLAEQFGASTRVVATKDKRSKTPGYTTRTKANVGYRSGQPALVLLDFDTKGMPPAVAARLQEMGGFQAAIKTVCPGIASSGSVWRASTSANLVNEATGFRFPNGGRHGYVLIADGADADRFVVALHERAYLAQLGWIVASKDGRALEKSIVDIAVRFAERLVFEVQPNLGPGLRQDPRPATVYDLPPLDSVAACPDLDAVEKAELARRIRADKLAIEPQLDVERTAFKTIQRAAAAAHGRDPATIDSDLEKLEQRNVLSPNFMLDGVDLPSLVSVGDLLADPTKFDGEEFYDPIEGRDYGHPTAMFYADKLIINSFAHGGFVYKLRHDYASIVAAIMAAPKKDAPPILCRMLFWADVTPPEQEELFKLAGTQFGGKKAAKDLWQKERAKRLAGQSHESHDPHKLPLIRLSPGVLPANVDAMQDALIAANLGLYKRGGCIVRIGEEKFKRPDGTETTALVIHELSEHALLETVAAVARFEKFSKTENRWVLADPTLLHMKCIQGRKYALRLPPLAGIISTPLLLQTGRLIDQPGYDAETGLFFEPLGTVFPPIPERPTREDALAALAILDDLLCEFPFVDDPSRAVARSALLTSVCRRALECAPMHAYTAPEAGTGKSYLADLICLVATGRLAPSITTGRNEEEFEKRLDGLLFKGVAVISIDNVNMTIESAKLSTILSQTVMTVRLLRSNRDMPEIQQGAFVQMTGNNLAIEGELTRRTIYGGQNANEERPELREFKQDPIAAVKADRGKYVSAINTILRAFQIAGRQQQQAKPLKNYDQWSHSVRDALMWLGCADACKTQETIRAKDTQLLVRKSLVEVWNKYFQSNRKTSGQVVDAANERHPSVHGTPDGPLMRPDLYAVLMEIAGGGKVADARRLSGWLSDNEDRVANGMLIKRDDAVSHSGALYWILTPKPSSNSDQTAPIDF